MKRKNKYSRRSSVSVRKKRVLPIILVAVLSLLVVFGCAVGLGAYLRHKALSYTPEPDYDFEGNVPTSNGKARAVYAPLFNYGDYLYGLVSDGYTDFSLPLGTSEKVTFASDTAAQMTGVAVGENNLEEYSALVHKYEGRLCGFFYSSAFEEKDEDIRRIKKSYEISLLCEASKKGIDDILILGINVDGENFDEIAKYLYEISSNSDASVGVAVSVATVLLTEKEEYILGRLRGVCDFVALDLRRLDFSGVDENSSSPKDLGAYLNELKYYLSSYSMRLVFSKQNEKYFDEAYELGFKNIQLVSNTIIKNEKSGD